LTKRPPLAEIHLVPPPWPALLVASRCYVRYAPGIAMKRRMLRLWLDVGLAQKPRPLRVMRSRYGTKIRVPNTEDLIMRYLYMTGSWEPCLSAFIASRLQPGDGFVDIGANIGYYSMLAYRRVGPTGSVTAIEPAPLLYGELVANIVINGCENVRPVRAAVTNQPGEITMFVPDAANLGTTTTVKPALYDAEMTVPGLPLLDVVCLAELERARIIKIDVEGAEDIVLGSLAPLLDRLRPDCEIAVEVAPKRLAASGETVDSILAPFLARGLHVYRVANSYMPEDYPMMLRRPTPPVRVREPITEQMDLVLSFVDADVLA